MRRLVVFIFLVAVSASLFSQKDEKIIFTIDDKPTTVGEFKRVYEKNLDAINDEESRDVTKNLDLYINYKLKVKEAYKIQLDTLPSYNREMESYKNQLVAPYLKDTTMLAQLVKDAYFRTKNEVKAKHILVRLQQDALPKDTLAAYNKIIAIRDRIVNGESFGDVAVATSEDISAKDDPETGRKGNKGSLGYFGAFRMIYPFEVAAYNTKKGEISMPFRTRYGYHIVKNEGLRESLGSVEAAHILIRDTTETSKKTIDSIYTKLEAGEKFEDLAKEYSEDPGSKVRGGSLGKFSAGQMVKPFEDAAFSLEEDNYSKPFQTRYGWHIVKLIKKHPIASFSDLEKELKNKVKKGAAISISEKALLSRLKKDYIIKENESSKDILNNKNIRAIPSDSLQNTLFSIADKNITQEEFVKYTRNRRHKPVFTLYEEFFNQEVINYYKEDLVNREPEYAATLKEYEEGLLLFELMQQKIWDKSSKDTIALQNYFDKNSGNYKEQVLDSIKGQVINDYQNHLEKEWIADLRKNHEVKIKKSQLKKLIKYYRKED
jgi:peptidyl-prolyl cis-trans isomerase SurA